jgi:uncharacterized membrane protein
MTLESSKTLGGIGALMMFIGVLPYISTYGIIELIGAILVLIALHGLSNLYNEAAIFSNALYGVIVAIIGVIAAVGVAIAIVLPSITDFITKLYPSWNGDWSTLSSLSSMTPDTSAIEFSDLIPFISAAIAVFIVILITSIIAAFLIRRSLKLVSTKSGVGLFSTAGLMLLVGAVLLILFVIPGLIVMWIAALLLAIAFFQIKPQQPMPPAAATTPTPV